MYLKTCIRRTKNNRSLLVIHLMYFKQKFSLKSYFYCQIRVAEYYNVRSQLNAINRKQSGRYECSQQVQLYLANLMFLIDRAFISLAVRDISNLVKPEDIITSEHLATLLVIVPKYSQKEWLSSYETLTSYVVSLCFQLLTSSRTTF